MGPGVSVEGNLRMQPSRGEEQDPSPSQPRLEALKSSFE